MISYRYPLIAQEAAWFLLILLLAAILVFWRFGYIAASPIVLSVLLGAYLFRDPPRKIPPIPLAIVAPIDGRILAVASGRYDPYLKRKANYIHLLMYPWDVYSVHSPMEGKVLNQWFSLPNNNIATTTRVYSQWIQSDEQDNLVMVVRPRNTLRRWARCYVHSGERIGQGQRCGFAPLGAQCELYLPEKCRIDVKTGDKVEAGTDVVATLIH